MALGLWIGRRVRGAADFFVASRGLGPGLIFSTMLAANIGAGSTVGATALGYANGISAWWWVGSAGIGSIVLAFWIGPAMRRQADAHQLRTVGDYLEHRYEPSVRALASRHSLDRIAVHPRRTALGDGIDHRCRHRYPPWIGCAIGGAVITVYFAAGGLLTSARVNVVQLTVKMVGFSIALPLAFRAVSGGLSDLRMLRPTDDYTQFWRAASPGLVNPRDHRPALHRVARTAAENLRRARRSRRSCRRRSERGRSSRVRDRAGAARHDRRGRSFPRLPRPIRRCPMLLVHTVPPLVGAIGLTAVFSAEISASDAILFMLTTSLSQDFYRRFINPAADDRRVLRWPGGRPSRAARSGRCSPSRSAAWSTRSRSSTR